MFLSIGMLKQKYFLTDIFILSAEKQPIKLSWRKIECLHISHFHIFRIVYWSVKFLSLFVSHIRYSSNLINFHKLKDFRYF